MFAATSFTIAESWKNKDALQQVKESTNHGTSIQWNIIQRQNLKCRG
jgi:hypothetical protein